MPRQAVKKLSPLAISLVILTMVVAVGGLMLVEFKPVSYVNNEVTDEKHASSGSVPETFTVDNVGKGLDQDSETIVLQDNETSTNLTLSDDDYNVVSYETGEFNVTDADIDDDGDADVTNTDDTYFVDYTYNTAGTSTNIITQGLNALQTFGSFFTVIVVVGIGAVLLLLLQVFRSSGVGGRKTVA